MMRTHLMTPVPIIATIMQSGGLGGSKSFATGCQPAKLSRKKEGRYRHAYGC